MQENTQKNRIIIGLLACACVCSVLAGFLIWYYITPSRTTIYVFNDDYYAGEPLTADLLTPLQVDSAITESGGESTIGTHMVTSEEYSEIIRAGDYLRIDVAEGMPLTSGMLSVQGGSTLEVNMTSDSIAVSFPVDSFSGVTNSLKVGSRVNIYSVIDSEVRLIQQNKRVLEVFSSDGSLEGIAVEEDVYESMELIYAVKYGSIYLGLVDASGYQTTEGGDPVYSGGDYYDDGTGSGTYDADYEYYDYGEFDDEYSDYEEDAADDAAADALGLDFMDDIEEGTEEPEEEESESDASAVFTP